MSVVRLSCLFACVTGVTAALAGEPAVPAAAAAPPPASSAPAPTLASEAAEKEWQGLLNLGASLTERGDYPAAEIAYWQILHARQVPPPLLKGALLGLAHMHRRQGAFTKACAIYERFLKDYPGDEHAPDALLDLGRTLRAMGAYKLALTRFYGVINATLKLPGEGFERYQLLAKTAQFEIAETHFQAGEFADAHKFFARLRLLDLAPVDAARAQFKAAAALASLHDPEGTLALLREYLERWPDGENAAEARYLLATTYRQLNRPQEAFAATLELLQHEQRHATADPKRWLYWQRRTGNQLANDFFESGDIAHALALYTSLAALSDEPAWRLPVVYQIALCRERLGAADEARECYRSIVAASEHTTSPELAELGRVAAWRLEHLEWRGQYQAQVHTLFDTRTGQPAPAPSSPHAS